jgi:hypothetical protein
MEMEIDKSHTRKERSPRRSGEDTKDTFLAPTSAEKLGKLSKKKAHRIRTEDEESNTSIVSRSSVASSPPVRGKKRKLAPSSVSPKVSEKLMQEIGTSSPADVSAEHARQVAIVMKVAINSTHLKGTYIRDLKNATAFFSAAWKDKTRKRSRERYVEREKETKGENTDARVTLLEEENSTLRRELAEERAAHARECTGRSDRDRKSRPQRSKDRGSGEETGGAGPPDREGYSRPTKGAKDYLPPPKESREE